MFLNRPKASSSPTEKIEFDNGITMVDQNIRTPEIESFALLTSSLGIFSPNELQPAMLNEIKKPGSSSKLNEIKKPGSNPKLSVIIPDEKDIPSSAYYDGVSAPAQYYVSPLSCYGLRTP